MRKRDREGQKKRERGGERERKKEREREGWRERETAQLSVRRVNNEHTKQSKQKQATCIHTFSTGAGTRGTIILW